MHLVCSHAAENSTSDVSVTPPLGEGSPVATSLSITRAGSTDGIRHRHSASQRRQDGTDTPGTIATAPVYAGAPHGAFQQFYG